MVRAVIAAFLLTCLSGCQGFHSVMAGPQQAVSITVKNDSTQSIRVALVPNVYEQQIGYMHVNWSFAGMYNTAERLPPGASFTKEIPGRSRDHVIVQAYIEQDDWKEGMPLPRVTGQYVVDSRSASLSICDNPDKLMVIRTDDWPR